jgi:transcriptional regulator with XRE-family HTH domain
VNIKNQIRVRILEKMKASGLSQDKLARLINSERRVINRQLKSDQTSIEKLIQFAEVLGIKIEINFSDN